MPKITTPQDVIDKFQAAIDSERLRSTLVEAFDDEPFSVMSEWAESLTTVAEAIDTARDALEEWAGCEEREERADAKERALDALGELVDAWNDSPIDMATLNGGEIL